MESYRAEAVQLFQREMIYRQMAWVNILRIKLRGGTEWESDAKPFLIHDGDLESIQNKNNKCAALLILQGHCIYDAMRSGTLQGFDSFQLEGHMAQLSTLESQCVRIKNIPIPRQYSFFTRLFVWLFIVTLPFSFIPIFDEASRSWLVIPVTLVFAFVYGIVERTGAVIEDPFENLMTGVPMNAFCIEIESDLRETLQETVLPELPKITKNGYLY